MSEIMEVKSCNFEVGNCILSIFTCSEEDFLAWKAGDVVLDDYTGEFESVEGHGLCVTYKNFEQFAYHKFVKYFQSPMGEKMVLFGYHGFEED